MKKAFEDFDLPVEYNTEPDKCGNFVDKPYKRVDDGTGMSFKLYPDEVIVDYCPGENNVKLDVPGKNGKRVSALRAKKGSMLSAATRKKVSDSLVKTKKKRKQIEDLSVMVRELLADPEIVKHMTQKLPEWANYMDEPNAAALIIGSAIMKAMDVKAPGQIQAAEFLRKVGWGDKYDVNVNGEVGFFAKPEINFEVVEPKENLLELEEGEVNQDESGS